ncbi:unnamed protein product [Auanema sp. JU1783]|nr:unnamed protein product [Auanema sp. JU1783]
MPCWALLPGGLILSSNRLSPSPCKLLILQFIWILPYILLANYLERSLLPLRLLCYTQSDLLAAQPLSPDFGTCLNRFFSQREPNPECQLSTPPKVLIKPSLPDKPERVLVIRTGPGSLDYRNFIRRTWKPKIDSYAPVIFVCATSPRSEVEIEAKKYNDILQFEFADSYHNLSWKMMAIYGFVLRELPTVQEIIVINDDTIVNATSLRTLSRPMPSSKAWIIGKISRGYPRLFMSWLPWHVPGEMYPHLCYPRFTQGSSFILSREGARLLLDTVCKVPFVHLDDIFVGVISNCISLHQIHHDGFDKHTFSDFVVYHYQYSRHSPEYLEELWHSSYQALD